MIERENKPEPDLNFDEFYASLSKWKRFKISFLNSFIMVLPVTIIHKIHLLNTYVGDELAVEYFKWKNK